MKVYQSFDEIDRDLKRISLERQIALEELKTVKNDFEQVLKPINMMNSVLKIVSKYGILVLIKKMFK